MLDMPDLKVLDVRTQVFVENLLNRSARLDILATDSNGRKFNVEIQRSDKGAERKRARYNSSMMDASFLEKGRHFSTLPETFVIFITEHDYMGEGLPVYPVERCVLNTKKTVSRWRAYCVCKRGLPGRLSYRVADARFFLYRPSRYAL